MQENENNVNPTNTEGSAPENTENTPAEFTENNAPEENQVPNENNGGNAVNNIPSANSNNSEVPPQYTQQSFQYNTPPQNYPPQNNPYYQNQQYNPQSGNYPPPPPPSPYGYAPYGNMPPMYPPVRKKKSSTGVKVFIIILAVLYGISSFAMVGALAYTALNANLQKNQSNNNNYDRFDDYEDYFGQFEDFFGNEEQNPGYGNGGEDNRQDNAKNETEEYVQPDIKYSPNLDGITINSKPEGEPLSAEEVYNKVILSTVSVFANIPLADGSYEESSGSGIIITEDGFIVTNSHVIGNTKSTIVTVITEDGTEYPAIIAAFDKATDLAVLKIDASGLTPAEFGNDEELNIGEWVIAIGSPGGIGFSGSLTRGVISGLDRVIDSTETSKITYIQTDAVINPGNSGGPLVNMYGQVVGINTSKIAADAYEGMGFSIPTTDAKQIIDQLLASGYVEGRVRVGITGQNNIYGNPYGVIIVVIDEVSSFTGTEAQVNDIIIAMDDRTVQSLNDLTTALQNYKAGDKAKVTLYRPSTGEELTVEITLLPDEGETQR